MLFKKLWINIIYYLFLPTHFPANMHFERTESYSFSNIKVFIYTTEKIQLDKNFTIEVIPLILQKRRMNFCDWKRTSKKFSRNNILLCIQADIIGTFRFSFYKSFFSLQIHLLCLSNIGLTVIIWFFAKKRISYLFIYPKGNKSLLCFEVVLGTC